MITDQKSLTRREFLAAAIAAAAVAAIPFEVKPTPSYTAVTVTKVTPYALTLKDLLEARETLRKYEAWVEPYVLVYPDAGVTPEMGDEWYRMTGTRIVYATAGKP